MSLDTAGIIAALMSHAQTLGVFEKVNGHESNNAPTTGITCDFLWVRTTPLARASGLASTTVVVTYMARIYRPTAQNSDDVDPQVMHAADELCRAYVGDFELGGEARNVDLFGEAGIPLSVSSGWLQFDSSTKCR
ncbi:MAG TPA: hypothetical protein VFY84_13465, partial [Jiangellales bacterium]|nr:hypothetical protein [Jiangellales bacterium]